MGKKLKKLLAAALALTMLFTFCAVPMTASAEDTNLKFDSEGKFKIVVFSDVQDQYPVHQRVLNIMKQTLELEQPDLVVFTGDMTEINTKDVEVDYRKTVEQILGPVVEAGVPYSIVFGNHDNQNYVSGTVTDRDAMLAVWQSIGDCRTVDADPNLTGAGTCKIPIYSSNGSNLAFNLWMLDSGSYQNPLDGNSGYGSVQADQLAWMQANNDAGVNSIAFQHIPMPEMYNLFVEDANGTGSYNGKKYKLELIEGVEGKAGEFPAPCPADKSNEYAVLKEMGNVLGVVTGHDHLNDFSGKFEADGLELTAVPGMTYYNYGDEAIRGIGVIELDENDLSKYEYRSVKFSYLDELAGGTTETVYDDYDVINYSDLKENGNALASEYTISGGHTFTYDATSATKSAILKFRWTAGTKPGFQFSFDEGENGNISHPFGVWIKRADQVEPYGAWHLKPNRSEYEVKMTSAIKQGDTFDIEFGRLKVLEGDPKIVGQYYVYLKVNGKLVQEGYSNTAEDGGYSSANRYDCMVSNQIRFGGWGNGGDDVISAFVEPEVVEEYAAYDVIGYEDLLDTGNNPLTPGGIQLTKTNNSVSYVESTEAAKTHSVIFKLRWTMETLAKFEIHLQGWGGKNNFAYFLQDNHWQHKANNAASPVALNPAPISGDYYDLEVARLMVTAGENAGKYYTYFKVDGETIFEKYVDADDENTTKYLGNKIFLGFADGNTCKISATPYDPNPDSPYYAYDEVSYYDLLKDGTPLSGDVYQIGGNSTFTYNKTADTGSAIFKFRWKEANAGSSFQLSFDREGSVAYMFGVQLYTPDAQFPNGYIWLRPGYKEATKVELPEALEMGKDYDIEFARLKVKNGEHKGDWHVYFKINDVLVAEDYVDGSLITKQGNYTTNPGSYAGTVSNIIYLTFWGNGAGNKIAPTPYVEEFDVYDEVTYEDFRIDGNSLPANGIDLSASRKITYAATSPSYSSKVKFRWTAGSEAKMVFYFDAWPNHPYGFAAKPPLTDVGGGAIAGENGAWHLNCANGSNIVQMDKPIEKGETFDIEIGRLLVKNGKNKGKYYVYAIVNDELIKDYYTEALTDPAPSNIIRIVNGDAENIISSIPETQEPEVPVDPNPDALYYDYDEITYADLKKEDGSALGNETTLQGGTTLKYNSTSPTGSVKFNYRWIIGSVPKIQMSFERVAADTMAYRFGAWMEAAGTDAAYPNGSLWVGPAYGPKVEMPKVITAGSTHDVEFARLKVKNGEHAGKYHVYYKLDGELISEYYVDADVVDADGNYTSDPNKTTLNVKSGDIFFAFWGSEGNKITATPIPETYEAYDDLTYNDLFVGDISMAGQTMTSNQNYTYNATSPSYSAILKYRWIPGGDEMKFTTFFDDWVYPFCFAAKTPNQADFGAAAGPNGAWHLVPSNGDQIVQMDTPVVAGKPYDIEVARLKVKTGSYAGKYLVYAKVNGEMIMSYYYDGVNEDGTYGGGTKLSNKIIIAIPAGNAVTATPFVEEYEQYDEIGIEDLKDAEGNALGTQYGMQGATVLTYDKTSATGSVIFKYRWKIGSVAKFQMSFEKTASDAMAYMFGAWLSAPGEEAGYPNGRMWLRPGMGPQVDLSKILTPGSSHNVEFARLKVKNGPNAGKYYVYIKIDDVLVASDYVAADVVDANGNYTSNPNSTALSLSNEIFFAFWGSEGNSIMAYKDDSSNVHDGIRGDFDFNGEINAVDFVSLKKVLFGSFDTSEMPEGIADFNNDGNVDILDLIAMKNYLLPEEAYAKSGSLTLGMQEHLLEDETKTAEYIADATATMGATAYRLSTPIHNLYYATNSNGVAVKADNMAAFEEMVAALKAKGITEILYVTDSYILPFGYANVSVNHNITVPDPKDDPENYLAWLKVNAAAFKELAKKFPEIKFFEPFNEINTTGTRFEKFGIGWGATAEEQKAYKFTVKEKAAIMADLCYYLSEAVKSVDPANQVTTPSICIGSNSVIENDFIEEFYNAIESGAYPTGKTLGDIRVDNYFTIVNVHAYADYTEYTFEYQAENKVNDWANRINAAYDVVKEHNDGGSRVWLTETGMSTYHSDGKARNEDKVAKIIGLTLEKLDNELTFIDTAIFYKIADISTNIGASPSETYFGLFYSGDDLDHDPYCAKPSAEVIYSYFHNGTTDYSALEALAQKYDK